MVRYQHGVHVYWVQPTESAYGRRGKKWPANFLFEAYISSEKLYIHMHVCDQLIYRKLVHGILLVKLFICARSEQYIECKYIIYNKYDQKIYNRNIIFSLCLVLFEKIVAIPLFA